MYGTLRRILACVVAVLCATGPAFARQGGNGIEQEFLVRGDAKARASIVAGLEERGFPTELIEIYPSFSIALFRFMPELTEDQLEAAIAALAELTPDGLEFGSEVNSELTIDRGGGQTGSLWVTGLGESDFENQYGLTLTRSDFCAQRATGSGVKIAIVDSGLVPNAPRAAGFSLDYGYTFVNGGGKGGVPVDAGDGIDNNGNSAADEGVGHGTFIASLLGLTAPGARHLHIKVLNDEGECEMSDLLAALEACIAEDVHVVNLSIVPLGTTTILKGAFTTLRQNGTIVVVSAGNSLNNPFGTNEGDLVLVGATSDTDAVWTASSAGEWVDIMAPGVTQFDDSGAPLPGRAIVGVIGVNPGGTAKFAAASGTSFAAAFISGAAACFRAANPSWPDDAPYSAGEVSPYQIGTLFHDALEASAVEIPKSPRKRIDAAPLVAGFDPVPRCPGDIARATSGEGPEFRVNGLDLAEMLVRFGTVLTDPRRIERANLAPSKPKGSTPEVINGADLAALLASWGFNPPKPCP
jgi:hypothetical protein